MNVDPDLLVQANPGLWLETYGKIKNAKGKIERATMNILQRRINAAFMACRKKGKPCYIIGLKPRKRGFSTMVSAIHYTELMKNRYEGVLVGNKLDTSLTVLNMIKVYAEHDGFKARWGSACKAIGEAIRWEHGSVVTVTTAKAGDSIRSQTPQFIHGTEVAHWDGEEEFLLGLMNALPDMPGVTCFLESTPEGDAGAFASRWTHARWPSDDECPSDQEGYWKKWAASCPDNGEAMLEDQEFIRIFAAWFEFEDARTQLDDRQRKHIESTLDAEPWYDGERELIAAYGEEGPNGVMRLGNIVEGTDVWEQLAWRRATIKIKCGRDPKKFDQEYPRDPASCAARGTRVATRRGWIPIEEVAQGDVTPYGIVDAVAFMGVKATIRVVTHLGYSVRVTGDHRVKLADGGFCRADDLIGKEIALDLNGLVVEGLHCERWIGFAGCEVSLEITEEFGRFLGYFMGNGSIYNATLSVVVDAKDEDVTEDVTRLLSRFGESFRRVVGPKDGAVEVRLSRKEIGPLFEILGIAKPVPETHWKRAVRVPECIWRSPKAVVREFLRGLFETDGWISKTKNNVKFFAKDLEFSRDVQRLLLGFGIHGLLREIVKEAKGKEYKGCEIVLHSLDAQRFCDVIGFVSARKQGRSERPVGKCGKPPTDYAMRDRVVSVEDAGEIDVYDVQINGEPVFCADGITVHNCFLASGRTVFDADAIEHYKRMALIWRDFGAINRQQGALRATWMPTGEPDSMFWRWETPKRGCAYLITVDTAEGEDQTKGEDPDRHSVLVLRRAYREPSGVLHKMAVIARVAPPCRVPIPSLVMLADVLSIYYGRCIVIPEMNSSGLAFMTAAMMIGIPIWKRQEWNKLSGKHEEKFGWRTSDSQDYGGVRTVILSMLQAVLREREIDIMCPNLVWELSKFVQKGRRMEAGSGAHDDDVLALAIGVYNIESATVYGDDVVERELPADLRDLLNGPDSGMNAHNW